MWKKYLFYIFSCLGLVTPHSTVIERYQVLTDEQWSRMLTPSAYHNLRQLALARGGPVKVIVLTYQGPASFSSTEFQDIKTQYDDADFIVLNVI